MAIVALAQAAWAEGEAGALCSNGAFGHVQCIRPAHFVHDTCQALEVFATQHGLDPHFFARLIWQESRFDPNALSPADARGIAQFIPSTAKLRGLTDPYNAADALEHSAEYLAEMVERFGNEGLAAGTHELGFDGWRLRDALTRSHLHLSDKMLAELAAWEPRSFRSVIGIAAHKASTAEEEGGMGMPACGPGTMVHVEKDKL